MKTAKITSREDLERFLETATGGINIEQGLALAQYASEVTHGDIVEIGSYKGKSAVAITYGMAQAPAPEGRMLYCIDPHAPFIGQLGGEFGAVDRRDFFKLMLETEGYENTALINLPADQVALGWSRPIGFLFIDGDHRYHAVREDFMRWVPHVLDGGIIAIDDSLNPKIGPTQLVKELVAAGFDPLEKIGKITFYRKTQTLPQSPFSPNWREVLVVAEKNVLSGGLLRFARLQRAVASFGIQISFAFDKLDGPFDPDNCDVLSMDQAMQRKWDATLLPGAGFSAKFIERLTRFQSDQFWAPGFRNVLKDRSREDTFLEVNRTFLPHSVIFNAQAWTPGSFSHFKGDRFAVVEGAVDPVFFAPAIGRTPRGDRKFVVGMQAKYLKDIKAIAPKLPDQVVFHVIRRETPEPGAVSPKLEALAAKGRLKYLGNLDESELPAFYENCDCILHLERAAGWANLVAEAMACGVPVVCSAPGTLAIATDGQTALVVDPEDPSAVIAALADVLDNPAAAVTRAKAARAHISTYSWTEYAGHYLKAAQDDGRKHYLQAPELGMHGKWPKESRLHDIDLVTPLCKGADVLDIGCAEGVVSATLMAAGARSVHGFDIDAGRIMSARALLAGSDATFHADSVVPWDSFTQRHADLLRPTYDMVLFLAIYQHLRKDARDGVVDQLLAMTGDVFALRTPDPLFEASGLHERIIKAGFAEAGVGQKGVGGSAPIRLYRRNTQST